MRRLTLAAMLVLCTPAIAGDEEFCPDVARHVSVYYGNGMFNDRKSAAEGMAELEDRVTRRFGLQYNGMPLIFKLAFNESEFQTAAGSWTTYWRALYGLVVDLTRVLAQRNITAEDAISQTRYD